MTGTGTPYTQTAVERLMDTLGRERYRAKAEASKRAGRMTDMPPVRSLMRASVDQVTGDVKAWIARAVSGKSAHQGHAAKYLQNFKPDVVAMIALRGVLDTIGTACPLVKTSSTVGNMLEEEARYMQVSTRKPELWRDLRKRLKKMRSRRSRAMILRDVSTKLDLSFEPWPRREKIRLGLVLVEIIRQRTGLIEIHRASLNNRRRSSSYVVPAPSTLKWLEEAGERNEGLFPFWLPTVVPPNDWEDAWSGGYMANIVLKRPIVKAKDRQQVRDFETGDVARVYAAVNAVQRTPWRVNRRVYATMKTFWDAGREIADLPERVDEPPIARPEGLEADAAAMKAFKMSLAERRARVVVARSRRVLAAKTVFMAERFLDDHEFFFPHQLDFRGRMYPVPFFLQPQGPSLARGLLEFARGLPITTPAGRQWFMVHGANCFGVDKVALSSRGHWVAEHAREIRAVAEDPVGFTWWAQADKPWEFLAWCFEASELEKNLDFHSHLPIAMDGSNNGLQIFSMLLRDSVGAEATNCAPSDFPRDVYQDVADRVTGKLAQSHAPEAAKWLEFVGGKLPRAATKRSVMTLPYGSTFHSCIHYTRDWYEEARKARGGEAPFERGYKPCVFLARLIWDAIGETVAAARACMDWLRKIAGDFAEAGLGVRWTAPSGFPVVQMYTRGRERKIETKVGDTLRTVRYHEPGREVARRRQMNGVSPNFVHSLDAAVLVETVNRCSAAGIESFAMVHDSYGVHADAAPEMARVLREVYADTFKVDVLQEFRREVQLFAPAGYDVPPPPEYGDFDVERVKKSTYFFA